MQIIVAGIGCGYHIEPLRKLLPKATIFLYEPIDDIRKLIAEETYCRPNNENITIIHSKTELDHLIQNAKQPLKLFIHPWYRRNFPDMEARILDSITNSGKILDVAGIERFFRLWSGNFFKLLQKDSIRFLAGKHPSQKENFHTLLYCGAGPGLLSDLERLKTFSNHFMDSVFLVASDTALAPLIHAGYTPDIVISVDSGPGTPYHFAAADRLSSNSVKEKKIAQFPFPVISWSAGPSSLESYFQNIYYYRSTLPFDQILGEGPLAQIPEWINLSRNTMGIALLLAAEAKISTVYAAGADFTSRKGDSHVRGSGYTLFAMQNISRCNTIEMYRPGGYTEKLSGKNRLILDEVQKMADINKIRLRFLSADDLDETDSLQIADSRKTKLTDLFKIKSIETKELRQFLSGIWEKINFSEFGSEISVEQRLKWKRLLKSGSF